MTVTSPPPPGPPVTESDLLAYVDDRLDRDRRDQVEAYLVQNPDDAHRVAADIAVQEGLKLLFGRPSDSRPVTHPRRRAWPRRAAWAAVVALGGFAAGYGAGALEAAPPLLACLR